MSRIVIPAPQRESSRLSHRAELIHHFRLGRKSDSGRGTTAKAGQAGMTVVLKIVN